MSNEYINQKDLVSALKSQLERAEQLYRAALTLPESKWDTEEARETSHKADQIYQTVREIVDKLGLDYQNFDE